MNFYLGNSRATMRYSENRGSHNGGPSQVGGQKLQFSEIICPFCHTPIAPGDKDIVKTSYGTAHYSRCALPLGIKILVASGISRPTEFSTPEFIQKFLQQQTNNLLEKPDNPTIENQLTTIIGVAQEYFGCEIRFSKLMAAR